MLRLVSAISTTFKASRHVLNPLQSCNRVFLLRCTRTAVCNQKSRDVMGGKEKPKILVLTGPTGVGKTELSLMLSERFNGEVISADSVQGASYGVQVFTGMDVGSDKLLVGDRRGLCAGIPHHLIDVLDPFDSTAEYSAGQFHDAAHEAVADVHSRGRTAVVIGGTGFYLRTFMNGKPGGGKASPEIEQNVCDLLRTALVKCAGELGLQHAVTTSGIVKAVLAAAEETGEELKVEEAEVALWQAGCEVLRNVGDSAGADRIEAEKNNWYRLQRAVEIVLVTGQPTAASAVSAAASDVPYDYRTFFLFRPRIETFRRIDARVEQMVVSGLLDEAHALMEAGLKAGSAPITRAIGYRQALEWLEQISEAGVAVEADVRRLASAIQAASRQLAGSQIKFHRGDEHFKWVDASAGPKALTDYIIDHFNAPDHCGGCGEAGRLSKEELDAVKRYLTEWTILDKPEAVNQVLQWLKTHGYITHDGD